MVFAFCAALAGAAAGATAAMAADPAVTGVRLGTNGETTRVVLDITKPVPYSAFLLENPYRLVIDLPEVDWSVGDGAGTDGRGVVEGLRYGLFRAGNSRIVVDLKGPVSIAANGALANPPRLMFDLQPVAKAKFTAGQTVSINNWKPPSTAPAAPVVREKAPGDRRRVVVIDPGHGGVDPGAVRGGTQEKHVTMAAAQELRRQLESSKRYRVVMTRSRDIFVELRDRVNFGRRNDGDVFISLHADTHPKRQTRGASVYTLSQRASDKEAARLAEKENRVDEIGGIDISGYSSETTDILMDLTRRRTMEESSIFANYLLAQFSKHDIRMQPIKTHRFAGFAVLKAPDVPSVLVEMGYLSNNSDKKALLSKRFQRDLGQAVLIALDDYFKYLDDLAAR